MCWYMHVHVHDAYVGTGYVVGGPAVPLDQVSPGQSSLRILFARPPPPPKQAPNSRTAFQWPRPQIINSDNWTTHLVSRPHPLVRKRVWRQLCIFLITRGGTTRSMSRGKNVINSSLVCGPRPQARAKLFAIVSHRIFCTSLLRRLLNIQEWMPDFKVLSSP